MVLVIISSSGTGYSIRQTFGLIQWRLAVHKKSLQCICGWKTYPIWKRNKRNSIVQGAKILKYFQFSYEAIYISLIEPLHRYPQRCSFYAWHNDRSSLAILHFYIRQKLKHWRWVLHFRISCSSLVKVTQGLTTSSFVCSDFNLTTWKHSHEELLSSLGIDT